MEIEYFNNEQYVICIGHPNIKFVVTVTGHLGVEHKTYTEVIKNPAIVLGRNSGSKVIIIPQRWINI